MWISINLFDFGHCFLYRLGKQHGTMNQFFRVSMIFVSASRSPNFLMRFLFASRFCRDDRVAFLSCFGESLQWIFLKMGTSGVDSLLIIVPICIN